MTRIEIADEEMPEFIGQMIDIFEDFLDEKGVTIEHEECDDEDAEGTNIYGYDYDEIADAIRATLASWHAVAKKKEENDA